MSKDNFQNVEDVLFAALRNVCRALYAVDLVHDSFQIMHAVPEIANFTEQYTSARACLAGVVKAMYLPAHQARVADFYNLSTWTWRLQSLDSVQIDALNSHEEWVRTILLVSARDANGVPTEVVLIVQNVHDVMKQNLANLEQNMQKLMHKESAWQYYSSAKDAVAEAPRLEVRCFGDFEVFYQGEPLTFKYQKTKELLAYLVDRRGAKVSAQQIICTLWEDDDKHADYYQTLRKDLLDTLRKLPFLVVETGYGVLAVAREALDCDYFNYREGVTQTKYYGEYMEQYPWAVTTRAALDEMVIA